MFYTNHFSFNLWYLPGYTCVGLTWLHLLTFTSGYLSGYKCQHSPVWYLPGYTCVVPTCLHLCGAYLVTPVWCLPVYTCRHSPVWYIPGYTCGGLRLVDPCFVHLHRVSVNPQILVFNHLNYKGVQHFSQGILSPLVSKKIIEQKI